jgi:hippurate hydrolase
MKPVVDRRVFDRMVAIRRDLHRHPELSWQETRTAERVSDALASLGILFRRVAGTGIVADLPGPDGVPRIALRADMDALPIHEETELPFASIHEGVMHACGHDGHTSMLLGAAELLAGDDQLPAPVRLIFQPAEELGAGAKAMVEAGAVDGVAMIFGGHLDRHYQTGSLVVTEGVVNASTDSFRICITGQGAHAARPHEAIDAVVVGSLIVMAIQTIVSREVNPAHPSVITVGRFQAGTASNVIAGQAELEGTIRSQDPEVRTHLRNSIRRIAESSAKLHDAGVTVEVTEGTPSLRNTPEMASVAREAASRVVGQRGVCELTYANMGAEDFSCYLERVPGCYIRFGAQVPGREGYPAHSSKFDFDEEALGIGAAWLYEVAREAGETLRRGAGWHATGS